MRLQYEGKIYHCKLTALALWVNILATTEQVLFLVDEETFNQVNRN